MIILIALVLLVILIFRCRANAGGVAVSQNVGEKTFSVFGGVVGSVFGPIGGILGGIYGPK